MGKKKNKKQCGHLVQPTVKSAQLLLLESGLGRPTSLMNSIPVSFLIWILSVCVCVRPMLWNTICPRSGPHVCACAFSKQNQNDWPQGVDLINGSPLVSHKGWVTCRFYILCFLPWDELCYTHAWGFFRHKQTDTRQGQPVTVRAGGAASHSHRQDPHSPQAPKNAYRNSRN